MTPMLLLALLMTGLTPLPQDSTREQADKLYFAGCAKRNSGDIDGAIRDFGEALKLAPDVAGTWSDRAALWVQKKDYDKAIADYTQSIDQYLIDHKEKGMITGLFLAMDRLSSRADCKFAKGDVDGALSDHTRAVELLPSHGVTLIRRAEFKLKLKNTDGAMADFDKAVTVAPDRETSWEARGKARYQLQNYDGALSDYTRAIDCNREYVNQKNKDRKEGRKIKENLDLRYMRACIQLDKGDYDGAIADFSEVIKVNPKHAYTWHNRGGAKRLRKDLDGAIADYSQAIEIDPKDALHWHWRGVCKFSKGDYAGTMADCGQATQLDPQLYNAFCFVGDAGFESGAHDRAVEAYSKAIELAPKNAILWFARGRSKLELRDMAGALSDGSKAIELDPSAALFWEQRAEIREAGGDDAGALADYAKAISVDPKDDTSRLKLGWVQYRNGRYVEARESMRQAGAFQIITAPILFVIGVRLGNRETALKELSAHLDGRKGVAPDDWHAALTSYLLGRTSEADLLKAVESGKTESVPTRKCQAFFYAGSLRLAEKRRDEAIELFRKAVDQRTRAAEFAAAQAELKALGAAPVIVPAAPQKDLLAANTVWKGEIRQGNEAYSATLYLKERNQDRIRGEIHLQVSGAVNKLIFQGDVLEGRTVAWITDKKEGNVTVPGLYIGTLKGQILSGVWQVPSAGQYDTFSVKLAE